MISHFEPAVFLAAQRKPRAFGGIFIGLGIRGPHPDDYFVLKPKHSGFFATPLELLLRCLEVRRLIVTGVAGNNCVLYTAADAYMRDFAVSTPPDCIASLDNRDNDYAVDQMRTTLKADIRSSTELQF